MNDSGLRELVENLQLKASDTSYPAPWRRIYGDIADMISARIAQPTALAGIPDDQLDGGYAAPAGMALVPREPTEEMKVSALHRLNPLGALVDWQHDSDEGATRPDVTECWTAMLAAAPAAQVAEHGRLWTDDECRAFASVAFRHSPKNLPDGVTLQDIRFGATRVNSAPAVVVDEAMRLRAAQGMWASASRGASWEQTHPRIRKDWLELADAALAAALSQGGAPATPAELDKAIDRAIAEFEWTGKADG